MLSIACLARRTACATFLGLAALLPAGAQAASFDCRAPADAFERTVCADPSLSALQAEVDSYRREMAGIPWRRGLRERHDAAMATLRENSAQDPAAIRRGLQGRLTALREENGWYSTHGLEEAPERRLRTACLPLPSSEGAAAQRRPCRVREFGALGTADGRRFAFALYDYPPDRNGELANESAILVLSAAQPGEWTVDVAERLTEAQCRRPRLIRAPDGATILLLPCAEAGTGAANAEMAYRRSGPSSFRVWQELDITSWTAALDRRMPPGTTVLRGIYPDYERLTASIPLWREDDPACCPTAGRAEARLGWDGDRLVLRDVAFRLGAQEVPQR
ncbi:lysozyme inhibitor LprI family protein [Neoroseomonas soli]|uniref:DUF1311 domain-containing protein n=1 Tax=Neoroseomonas soli TaxID=1081025 RepID=A0A9X9X1I5_9PROT|nr:hypothetical protein [Neoroseomonas soli]MBR0673264.1 hypothetical protein [Neoroseomonas soli]